MFQSPATAALKLSLSDASSHRLQRCQHHASELLNPESRLAVSNHTLATRWLSLFSVKGKSKNRGGLLRDLCFIPDAGSLCVSVWRWLLWLLSQTIYLIWTENVHVVGLWKCKGNSDYKSSCLLRQHLREKWGSASAVQISKYHHSAPFHTDIVQHRWSFYSHTSQHCLTVQLWLEASVTKKLSKISNTSAFELSEMFYMCNKLLNFAFCPQFVQIVFILFSELVGLHILGGFFLSFHFYRRQFLHCYCHHLPS